jgi:hypothetical protein
MIHIYKQNKTAQSNYKLQYSIVGSVGDLFYCGSGVGLHFLLHLGDLIAQSGLVTLLGGCNSTIINYKL